MRWSITGKNAAAVVHFAAGELERFPQLLRRGIRSAPSTSHVATLLFQPGGLLAISRWLSCSTRIVERRHHRERSEKGDPHPGRDGRSTFPHACSHTGSSTPIRGAPGYCGLALRWCRLPLTRQAQPPANIYDPSGSEEWVNAHSSTSAIVHVGQTVTSIQTECVLCVRSSRRTRMRAWGVQPSIHCRWPYPR